MTRRLRFLWGLAFLSAALLMTASPASAHVKWFIQDDGSLRWDLFFRPLPLALFGAVLLMTLAAGLLWRVRGKSFIPGPEVFGASGRRLSLLYGLVPLILGIHVAVPLLINGVQGTLFSPNNELPGVWGNLLGLVEAGVALSLFYGGLTRIAAGALGGLWFAGIFLLGLQPMLDNALFLGFAVFFFVAGRGPLSIDRLLFPRFEPSPELARYAIPAVRIGVGASFVAGAFTEKFANLPLGLSFLERYPLNFSDALGLPLADELFVLGAGSAELLIGLWLMLGIFVREIVVLAWFPTNVTLTLFAWEELIGHLPIYGVMAVLLIWGSRSKDLHLLLEGLRERLVPIPQAAKNTKR